MNCYEVKWATFIQDIFTYAKLLALFIIIGTGIVQLGRGKTENFTWEDTETDITKIALSFYSGELKIRVHKCITFFCIRPLCLQRVELPQLCDRGDEGSCEGSPPRHHDLLHHGDHRLRHHQHRLLHDTQRARGPRF